MANNADIIAGDIMQTVRGIARYRQILPIGNPFPSQIVYWDYQAMTKKIMEVLVDRDTHQNPITITYLIYDNDGQAITSRVVETVLYSGPFETGRNRVVNV